MAIGVGVRVFAGAEYFFLPKISLGAELGWGLSYVTTGRSETVYESVGQGTGGLGVRRSTIDGNVTQLFSAMHDDGMGLAGPSGSLRLNVYF
jgi:hypothetical protein